MSLLRPAELTLAMTKMRARRTPSNQAHVTNRLDDPLLLAADAATAAAFGFREIETTVPVLADAPSNAVAVTIGSCIGSPGILVQCSVEEAMELEMGIRGLVSYAETVSLYGTEDVFVDGDDTPYSKAILAAGYASRGVKMRVSSGAGAEVLMGGAAYRSMLYLESRCVSLARALGVQGVQNGGIDGASVAAAVPRGVRELMAENVMVMARNLEACTGNDALMSESDVRRTSRTLPILLAGSDYVCSGFGSIQRYDNMFGPSQWNAEDIDDWLAMQRDWGVDGGLRTADPDEVGRLRREAAEACRDVYRYLGLADFTDEHVELAVDAVGSKDLGDPDPMVVLSAAQTVRSSGLGSLEVAKALQECGYDDAATRVLQMLEARVHGDHLQTAAIFDEQMNVLSLVTDPNDYAGPGHRLRAAPERQREIDMIRQAKGVEDLRHDQAEFATDAFKVVGTAEQGNDPREVVIGVSPGVGRNVWRTLSGHDRRRGPRRAVGGARGGGLHRAHRAGEQHPRPRHGGPDRCPSRRLGHRDRPAGQGHRAHPPPRPATPGEPRALLHGADHHPRPLPRPRHQRRPSREGRDAGAGEESLHRRGHRGALPHERHRAGGVGTRARDPGRCPRGAGGGAVTKAFSGRDSAELTPDRLALDELSADDVRIHPDTLEAQARVAEANHNPQLAANLRRAAELALLSEDEVMALYEALRPHRSTADGLSALAGTLDSTPAPLTAALVREAAAVYERRGLLK